MENRIESIVTGANEIVEKIYQKIGEIDSCKAVLRNLHEAELNLLMPDGSMAELKPALDDEQLQDVKSIMVRMIGARIEVAAEFLEELSSGKKKPEPVPAKDEPTVEPEYEPMMALEPEPTPEPVPAKKAVIPAKVKAQAAKTSKMTVAVVEQMFRDGYTVEDIAKHYGYKTTQTVQNFITKNKIKVKILTQGNNKTKQLTEEDIPEIRALYTDGPFNLTEAAAEMGVTKKVFREFCEKNLLMKVKRDW